MALLGWFARDVVGELIVQLFLALWDPISTSFAQIADDASADTRSWLRQNQWGWIAALGVVAAILVTLWRRDKSILVGELEDVYDELNLAIDELNKLDTLVAKQRRDLLVTGTALDTTARLVAADSTLLRLLADLVRLSDLDGTMQALLDQFAQDVVSVVGKDARRSSFWVPGEGDHADWLVPAAHFKMPSDSLDRRRFFIGARLPPGRKRGVAAKVFLNRKLEVVRMSEGDGGTWSSNSADYWSDPHETDHLQYRSFVAIPVARSNHDRIIGVLCVDSMRSDLFDSDEVKQALLNMGSHLAAAFAIRDHVLNMQALM